MTASIKSYDLNSPASSLGWATDIHLDHANTDKAFSDFIEAVKEQNPSALLLTGDIDLSESHPVYGNLGVVETVRKIRQAVECPIFFVLGNHDFYGASIESVRAKARELSLEIDGVQYLEPGSCVPLSKDTVLIGSDGWYDGRAGDLDNSTMFLNDFRYIEDVYLQPLTNLYLPETRRKFEALAQVSIDHVSQDLPKLFKTYRKVILATHVPPYHEASLYEGKMSDAGSAPFFVNKGLGEKLTEIMKAHPENELLVLCGHTHSAALYQPLQNLTVKVGAAEYGSPAPQAVLKV